MKLKFTLTLSVLTIFFLTSGMPSLAAPPFQTIVGEEQYMLGPVNTLLDNPFSTIKYSGGVKAFSGTGPTYSFSGTNLDNLVQNPGINLPVGSGGSYDNCTANINSVYIDPQNTQHWMAWYHAEKASDCQTSTHIKLMAVAESFDQGITWTKLGPVITGSENIEGEGDGKVVSLGNYFYLFYNKALLTTSSSHVARSEISSLGKPGTWSKYYNGGWSEPGIGGLESHINNLPFGTSYISYNTYVKRFILILVSGRWGFFVYYTNPNPTESDLINTWTLAPNPIYPLVSYTTDPSVDFWDTSNWFNNDPKYKSLYAYPSIIGLDGDGSISGQQFYLYYMKLFPTERFNSRYLMRRKIILNTAPSDAFDSKVDLVRYEKLSRVRVSTEITHPNEGYAKTQILGQLRPYPPPLTQNPPEFRAIYECYIPIWNDYMLTIANPYPTTDPNNPYNTWKHCESDGDQFIRTVGYAATQPTTPFTSLLYRCFDPVNTNHFVSTDSGCEGKQIEFLIGYIQGHTLADVNVDGKIDILDLARIVNARTSATIDPYFGPEDVNGDGKLDATDLSIFLQNYTHL